MAKADRPARLEARLSEMVRDYTDALIAALEVKAAGNWGLFDHQCDRKVRLATGPILSKLDELAGQINKTREQLSLPAFDLHAQFLAARGPVRSDAVGEPKQAQAWLDRRAAAGIAG